MPALIPAAIPPTMADVKKLIETTSAPVSQTQQPQQPQKTNAPVQPQSSQQNVQTRTQTPSSNPENERKFSGITAPGKGSWAEVPSKPFSSQSPQTKASSTIQTTQTTSSSTSQFGVESNTLYYVSSSCSSLFSTAILFAFAIILTK